MIIYLLLQLIVSILFVIFYLLPTATLISIPVIGAAISSTLTTVILSWNAFMVTFPYAQDLWYIFLYIILPFEIAVLTLKLFLGGRIPIQH